VSGFWHGANWTFIVWGFLNALYFLPLLLTKRHRNNLEVVAHNAMFPKFRECMSIILTFSLTVFTWIFFRANDMEHAVTYISAIFQKTLFTLPELRPTNVIVLILFFIVLEWFGRRQQFAIEKLFYKKPRIFRWFFYMLIVGLIMVFNSKEQQEFIYFQF